MLTVKDIQKENEGNYYLFENYEEGIIETQVGTQHGVVKTVNAYSNKDELGGVIEQYKYEYDRLGRLIKEIVDRNGKIFVRDYKYIENICKIYTTNKGAEKDSINLTIIEYDKEGRIKTRTSHVDESEISDSSLMRYEYDNNGYLVKIVYEDPDSITQEISYENDENGNATIVKEKFFDGSVETYEYEYEYYPDGEARKNRLI